MIQRYAVNGGLYPADHGLVIYHSDYLAVLAERDASLEVLGKDLGIEHEALLNREEQIAALIAELEKAKALFRCYHCGFETSNKAEAEAHFGDGEGQPSICVWWSTTDDAERIQDHQQITMELNETREELLILTATSAKQAEALEKIAEGTEDKLPPFRCIDRKRMKEIAQAALKGGKEMKE